MPVQDPALAAAFEYAATYRQRDNALDATLTAAELRAKLMRPLPRSGRTGDAVIKDLIAATEGGLVRNTEAGFFGWVMGGSHTTGVAADWLTSIWGQNAAIFQTSPASAIAEEAAAEWIVELLGLPRESSVGFVTGATMAGFVGLAAARAEVLSRAGYEIEEEGLQGAPKVHIFLSDDSHASNYAALRYLGFGEQNFIRVAPNEQGVMHPDILEAEMDARTGPMIVIGTAGHINSGGFEDFGALSRICKKHSAWLHVDGAFGLWARVLPEKDLLTNGIELADSWSVDGHKWLQVPYDSGFAIIRDERAHLRAMSISAAYLNRDKDDGRDPSQFNPELSRRARGFAVWAVLQAMGRDGIIEMIRRHCDCASLLASSVTGHPDITVRNRVDLNQVTLRIGECDQKTKEVARILNEKHSSFVRTTVWKDEVVIRISLIEKSTCLETVKKLAEQLIDAV